MSHENMITALAQICEYIKWIMSTTVPGGPTEPMESWQEALTTAIGALEGYNEIAARYSKVLMEATGGRLSKTGYDVSYIMDCIREHYCDGCDVQKERDTLLKEREHPDFSGSLLNRDDYVRIGDVMDCLSEVFVPKDDLIHIEGLIEWAMGKRAISKEELLKPIVRCCECRFYNNIGCAEGFGWCEHDLGHGSSDEWYCANGERGKYETIVYLKRKAVKRDEV